MKFDIARMADEAPSERERAVEQAITVTVRPSIAECYMTENAMGRWVIVNVQDRALAWSGSQWVPHRQRTAGRQCTDLQLCHTRGGGAGGNGFRPRVLSAGLPGGRQEHYLLPVRDDQLQRKRRAETILRALPRVSRKSVSLMVELRIAKHCIRDVEIVEIYVDGVFRAALYPDEPNAVRLIELARSRCAGDPR